MRSNVNLIWTVLRGIVRDEAGILVGLLAAVVGAIWPFFFEMPQWGRMLIVSLSVLGIVSALIRLAIVYQRSHQRMREKHIPIILVVGRSSNDVAAVVADAFNAMRAYGFDEETFHRDFELTRENFVLHQADSLPPDPEQWKRLVVRAHRLIMALNNRLSGRRVFHVFLLGPISYAIGVGAALGTKHEVIFHHHQPGASPAMYHPVLRIASDNLVGEGTHCLKTRISGELSHLRVTGLDRARGVVYVALGLAGHHPAPVENLAKAASATFVEITSTYQGTIPIDADWLQIARQVNTVLLNLLADPAVKELHLFPALPLPIGFALGMAVDTRSAVRVHQWSPHEQKYDLVLHLNELRNSLFL